MRQSGRGQVWLIVAGIVTALDLLLRFGARPPRPLAFWAEGALLAVGGATVLAAGPASWRTSASPARRGVVAFFALGALRAVALATGLPVARANLVALGALALGALAVVGRRWYRRRMSRVGPPSRDRAA